MVTFMWHQYELCSLGFRNSLKTVTLALYSCQGQSASPRSLPGLGDSQEEWGSNDADMPLLLGVS